MIAKQNNNNNNNKCNNNVMKMYKNICNVISRFLS